MRCPCPVTWAIRGVVPGSIATASSMARGSLSRLVLFVEPVQHHRSADVQRDGRVGVEGVLGRQAGLHQIGDRPLHLLGAHSRGPGAERGPDQDQVAQNRVAHERLTHQARVVAQRLAPVAGFDVGGGEHVLAQRTVGHRVEQIVLLAEVPVDAGDADAEVLAQQRHAQVVDRYLLREFECAADDVVGVDGPAFASLTLIGGCLLCHYGHLHQRLSCAVSNRATLYPQSRRPWAPTVDLTGGHPITRLASRTIMADGVAGAAFVRFFVCYCNTYRRLFGT